ncbi:YdcF family protein [Thermorudis peleae]|uniref:YdcF family protein n=1 Tax=Thermorudis peleae TaxID=1382356 RepID=UPI00068A49A2|nr:YdcF family protein [Thermorudis peleae]MBX6753172.1 YdcF family protein [Thermorudis peleae]
MTEVTFPTRRTVQPLSLTRILSLLLLTGGLASAVGLAVVILAIYVDARTDERGPADAIIVLGAAQYGGRPSSAFRARLDHAATLFRAGFAPRIVLVGGTASASEPTEAEVGAIYLEHLGIPPSSLLVVPNGRNTWESLVAAKEPLHRAGVRHLLVVSDGFHLFRTKRMLHDLGFAARSSPTPTSPIRRGSRVEYAYMVRELGAYLAYLAGYA